MDNKSEIKSDDIKCICGWIALNYVYSADELLQRCDEELSYDAEKTEKYKDRYNDLKLKSKSIRESILKNINMSIDTYLQNCIPNASQIRTDASIILYLIKSDKYFDGKIIERKKSNYTFLQILTYITVIYLLIAVIYLLLKSLFQ